MKLQFKITKIWIKKLDRDHVRRWKDKTLKRKKKSINKPPLPKSILKSQSNNKSHNFDQTPMKRHFKKSGNFYLDKNLELLKNYSRNTVADEEVEDAYSLIEQGSTHRINIFEPQNITQIETNPTENKIYSKPVKSSSINLRVFAPLSQLETSVEAINDNQSILDQLSKRTMNISSIEYVNSTVSYFDIFIKTE